MLQLLHQINQPFSAARTHVLLEEFKAITGTQRIKKVNKQFVRAGCGTRPSREGRAEGGVRSGPLLIGHSFPREIVPSEARYQGGVISAASYSIYLSQISVSGVQNLVLLCSPERRG